MAARKQDSKTDRLEIAAIVLSVITVFLLFSFFSYDYEDIGANVSNPNSPAVNKVGVVGAYTAYSMIFIFGFSSYLIPLMTGAWAVALFRKREIEYLKIAYCVLILILVSAIFHNSSILHSASEKVLGQGLPGGVIGQAFASITVKYLSFIGGNILIVSILLITIFLLTEVQAYPILKGVYKGIHITLDFLKSIFLEKPSVPEDAGGLKSPGAKEGIFKFPRKDREKNGAPEKKPIISPEKIKISHTTLPEKMQGSKKPAPAAENGDLFRKADRAAGYEDREKKGSSQQKSKQEPDLPILSSTGEKKYQLPDIDLFDDPVPVESGTKDQLQRNAEILVQTLSNFGIEVGVEEITRGPAVTRYEIKPAPGVGVSKIKSKEHDIALAMSASSIRIVAPIPGKAAVGIEVPNKNRAMVTMKEIILSENYKYFEGNIPLIIGKDVGGTPVIGDLSQMPHILIAGATGSGKTVCINAIIMSILMSMTPDEIKMLLIDPKMVELKKYNGIPHLVSPVVTSAKKSITGLNWAVKEMEKRFDLFSRVGVNDIVRFNTRDPEITSGSDDSAGEEIPPRLPYIVIIIDELADLMMTSSSDVEGSIVRLAQLSRAVGIHLVIATQRPSVDVITGLIKANFPVRIAFAVSSKVDSRTILDGNGAETLLGKGDLLYNPPGSSKLIRAQGTMVSDAEIKNVISHWKKNSADEKVEDIISAVETTSGPIDFEDDLYDEAVKLILEHGQASASVLQRRLRIGYARAARLIDIMESNGIVGPQRGSKPREILIDSSKDLNVVEGEKDSDGNQNGDIT
ncbi:MAG: DNA translocase FtsK [Candidatus Aureabacteria bacterium]|nr:DNA translocase FtsK [Candidatus Auribacterota bacterium]